MAVKELINELQWMLEHTECIEDTPIFFGLSYPYSKYSKKLTRIEYDYDDDSSVYEDWLLLYSGDDEITIRSNGDIKNNE